MLQFSALNSFLWEIFLSFRMDECEVWNKLLQHHLSLWSLNTFSFWFLCFSFLVSELSFLRERQVFDLFPLSGWIVMNDDCMGRKSAKIQTQTDRDRIIGFLFFPFALLIKPFECASFKNNWLESPRDIKVIKQGTETQRFRSVSDVESKRENVIGSVCIRNEVYVFV